MQALAKIDSFLSGMTAVNSRLSGEEGSSVTAECLYSERYRYLIVPFIILHLCQSYLPSDRTETSFIDTNIFEQ